MTVRRLAVAAALSLVLAACSGDDDASLDTTPAPSPTTSATVAATTPETTSPTTEPAPQTAPQTLPAEPTTTATSAPPDEDQIKQDVIDAAFAAWKSLNDLRLDPTNDDLLEALARTRTGASLDSAIEIVTNYRVGNRHSITHPEFPASFQAYPETVEVDAELGLASVEYCRLGSNVFVETGGNVDGTDLVLDDTINAYRERSDLTLTDLGWLENGGVILKESSGAVVCTD